MTSRKNHQTILEAFTYTFFFVLLLYLVFTEKYLMYVTPRMKPYLIFSAVVLAVWLLSTFWRVTEPRHRQRSMHCLVLLIPTLLFLLPHPPVTTGNVTQGYLSAGTAAGMLSGAKSTQAVKSTKVPDAAASQTAKAATQEQPIDPDGYVTQDAYGNSIELHGYNEEAKTITISHKEFYQWIGEIYAKMDDWQGWTISIQGSVFKNPEMMNENEFLPSRLLMSCCAADLSPCGILCEYDKAPELKEGSWVTVQGTLVKREFGDLPEPHLQVTSIGSAEPTNEYVYPF